jgi:hypothetical protein
LPDLSVRQYHPNMLANPTLSNKKTGGFNLNV